MKLVALVRVSKDEQDTGRQVAALKAHEAETGEKFDQWVEDKLSRDMSDHRPEFQKLIKAVEARQVRRVVVEEFERFGVSGGREFAYYAHIFEKSSCELVSLLEGNLLGADFASQITTLMKGEASKQRQIKTAYAGQSKKLQLAKTGVALGGIPPWGFDKSCHSKSGELLWTLHYLTRSKRIKTTFASGQPVKTEELIGQGQAPRKSPDDRLEWIPSQDEARLDDIRTIYRLFTTEAISTMSIAKRLSLMGRSVYGHRWTDEQVESILTNAVYKGDWTYFKSSVGRFVEVRGQKLVEVDETIAQRIRHEKPTNGKKRRIQRFKSKEEWTIKEGHFVALVDPVTWEEAQRRLTARTKRKHPPRKGNTWLSGLLFCGGCGEKMYAFCQSVGVYGYHCQTYSRQYRETGKADSCQCGHNVIRHAEAEKMISDKLNEIGVILDSSTDDETALSAAYLKLKTGIDTDLTGQKRDEIIDRQKGKIAQAAGFKPTYKATGERPTFGSGTQASVDQWGQLDDYLAERFPGKTPAQILKALGIDPAEAVQEKRASIQDKIDEVEAEFKKWVRAKVMAESEDERNVIADKVRELQGQLDRLRFSAKPAPSTLSVFEAFRQAIAAYRQTKESEKLRLTDTVGKVFSRVIIYFKKEPWGTSGRFKYRVIPEKTSYILSSEMESTLPDI